MCLRLCSWCCLLSIIVSIVAVLARLPSCLATPGCSRRRTHHVQRKGRYCHLQKQSVRIVSRTSLLAHAAPPAQARRTKWSESACKREGGSEEREGRGQDPSADRGMLQCGNLVLPRILRCSVCRKTIKTSSCNTARRGHPLCLGCKTDPSSPGADACMHACIMYTPGVTSRHLSAATNARGLLTSSAVTLPASVASSGAPTLHGLSVSSCA